jgi:hypothetical protein
LRGFTFTTAALRLAHPSYDASTAQAAWGDSFDDQRAFDSSVLRIRKFAEWALAQQSVFLIDGKTYSTTFKPIESVSSASKGPRVLTLDLIGEDVADGENKIDVTASLQTVHSVSELSEPPDGPSSQETVSSVSYRFLSF